MKRTITGRAAARSMTLGELRQFVASIESLPDEALIKTRTTFRRNLRSLTVEEDDVGFRDYVRAVGKPEPAKGADAGRGAKSKATEASGV
jgi:hypothetical protein